MDTNDFRIAFTLVSLVAFVGIASWAWRRQRRAEFEEAAQLPFLAEDTTAGGSR